MCASVTDPRIVVITGAASGIGFATAELFRDVGDTVYGLDIPPTVPDGRDVRRVQRRRQGRGRRGHRDLRASTGGSTSWRTSPASCSSAGSSQISEAEYDRVHAVDLKGPFFLIQAALPHLRACQGNIVNVSSVAGNMSQRYATAYAAAKGGLTQLTRALALELSPEGIRVNAVCPGTVDTPLGPACRRELPDGPRPAGDGPADDDAARPARSAPQRSAGRSSTWPRRRRG